MKIKTEYILLLGVAGVALYFFLKNKDIPSDSGGGGGGGFEFKTIPSSDTIPGENTTYPGYDAGTGNKRGWTKQSYYNVSGSNFSVNYPMTAYGLASALMLQRSMTVNSMGGKVGSFGIITARKAGITIPNYRPVNSAKTSAQIHSEKISAAQLKPVGVSRSGNIYRVLMKYRK